MTKKGYFQRVSERTPTRFWINNVTREEARLAIAAGAVGCTQNPSYTWKMLSHPSEGAYARGILKTILPDTRDDNEAVCELQRRLVAEVARIFLPLYQASHGRQGYVSIQGDPIHEHDAQVIIDEGRRNRALGPNVMIKIPATAAGLEAMEVLLAENTPINATEVMGVAQAVDVCDLYDRVSRRTGHYPVSYISHIAGIYDEYLQQYVEKQQIDVSPDALFQAGLAVARKVHRLMRDRATPLGFIGGGARALHHFTEMVGADACITINWVGTADQLLAQDPPVIDRFHTPVAEWVIEELLEKVVEFRRGYLADGLKVEEYEEFGPVVHFRNSFVKAWSSAVRYIGEIREKR